jgi:hypothetical protein
MLDFADDSGSFQLAYSTYLECERATWRNHLSSAMKMKETVVMLISSE